MPTARIRNDAPTARTGEPSFKTVYTITAGTPIGLLLALTYSAVLQIRTTNIAVYVRIRTTD